MNILLTGGSGFIGGKLIARLQAEGMQVHALGRHAPGAGGIRFTPWDAISGELAVHEIGEPDAVIHLAGEPVSQRWNPEVKRRIRESRVAGTRGLIASLQRAKARPRVFVSASAIGYYGDRGEEILTESSAPGTGFLSETCREWETAALESCRMGSRVVLLRTGIVLGAGGALKQMLTPFRLGAGGRLGSGRQWMSWIHVQDMVGLIMLALSAETLSGAMNCVSPKPVRNLDFTRALGEAVHRPTLLPVPRTALRLIFGEMADVMLTSQRALPEVARSAHYSFLFPDIREALEHAVHDHNS